MSENLS